MRLTCAKFIGSHLTAANSEPSDMASALDWARHDDITPMRNLPPSTLGVVIATALGAAFAMLRPIDLALTLARQGLPVEPLAFLVDGVIALGLLGTSIALYVGKPWVRWVYVVGAVLSISSSATPVAVMMLLMVASAASGDWSRGPGLFQVLSAVAFPAAWVTCAIVVWRNRHAAQPESRRPVTATAKEPIDRKPALAGIALRPRRRAAHQYLLCGALFGSIFAWQCVSLWRLIPFERLANEHGQTFMLMSMGLGFVPLLLLPLLAVCVVFGMFLLAYFPAWLYWKSTDPRIQLERSQ